MKQFRKTFRCGLLILPIFFAGWINAADLDYGYDANGNVVSKTTASGTTRYTYDKLDRLDTEAGPIANRAHAYDPNGNRTGDGTTVTYTANTDRIATINGQSVTLDAAGNLTGDGSYKYLWNGLGQLAELRKPDSTPIATYYYDHRHRRSRKVTTAAAPQGVTTTFYIYDRQDHLLAEMGGSGEALMTYVWNGDILTGLVVHQPQRTVYTVQVDALGTPYQVRTIEGKIVWRWEPDGYGKTQPNEDVDGDGKKLTLNLRFPGQYFDRESGLHYNWHRYYSPRLGRYISPDPIGAAGGINTYGYVGGNPLSYSDPLGLQAQGLSVLCGPYFWACAGAATVATVIGAKGTADAISKASSAESCSPKECPPCKTVSGRIVPVGTVGYRPLDVIPDDQMQHGVYGSHHNMFVAQQNPNNCQCFWQKQKYVLKPGNLPAGAIPIEPFVN